MSLAKVASSTAMIYNSLKSAVKIWSDEDASMMDKIMTSFMSLGMVIPMVKTAYDALRNSKILLNAASKLEGTAIGKLLGKLVADTTARWSNASASAGQQIA